MSFTELAEDAEWKRDEADQARAVLEDAIREAIHQGDATGYRLARVAGINTAAVYAFRDGHKSLHIDTLKKMAKFLDEGG